MASITIIDMAASINSATHSRITDLAIITVGGEQRLVSTTRYDGVLQEWLLDGGVIVEGAQTSFEGDLIAGSNPSITTIAMGQAESILIGGGTNADLQVFNAVGAMPVVWSQLAPWFDGLQSTTTVSLADASQVVYGAIAGESGIAALRLDSLGTLQTAHVVAAPMPALSTAITSTAHANIAGQSYLIVASAAQNGLSSYLIDANGGLSAVGEVGTNDGLWINAPSAMQTVAINGRSYIVLASAGTDSLSVIEIDADGNMQVRDHLMDDRATRFGGVTALEIVQKDGKTFVIAAGADDGISVFLLIDGGLLVHRATIEDTVDITLDNVSAIAALSQGSGVDIFVASSSEPGVTQLYYDTGGAGVIQTAAMSGGTLQGTLVGDVLQGHDGADVIMAGSGDDILRDGAGADILSGGTGADVFIMAADGASDTVTDFTVGEDTLDLSLWPMMRDISQLFMTITDDGMRITYGDEVLIVQSSDGNPIDYRLLANGDVIGGTRLPVEIVAGYAGPLTPARPTDASDPAFNDQGTPIDPMALAQMLGADQLGTLRSLLGGPESGLDAVINGSAAAETLSGTSQADVIFAGGGSDTVNAGDGHDVLFGRAGNDLLVGGSGADTIIGGAGADILIGGIGHDILIGGAGADTFIFNAGNDLIEDFALGLDQITLNSRLWTGLTSATDLLTVYGSVENDGTVITFETGDTLTIAGIIDLSVLADDIALF